MTRRGWLIAVVIACAAAGCKKSKAKPKPAPDQGSATPVTAADAAPAAASTRLVPLVWTIEKAGKTSRLLATIDAGIADVEAALPAALWEQIKNAKTVALQWNFAEVTMPMLKRTDGALSTDLTAEEKAKLEAAIGAPFVAELDKVKPSFTATVVSAHGLPTANPMQAVINQRAQDAGVPTVYVETGVVQQALLDRWLDVKAVKALIADLDEVKAGNLALVAAYEKGDEAALATMRDHHMPWKTAGLAGDALTAMRKATIDDRHAAWIVFLRPLLDVGDAFVAIDALDVVGPGGLAEGLREAGYTVTRQ